MKQLPNEPAAQDAYADLATALRGGVQNNQPQVNPRMRG
jgi:flagellum-specific ATP synthase